MSAKERRHRALSRQGTLTGQEFEQLKSDLLQLIDGKDHPKSTGKLKEQLVRFCGWSYHKVNGPRLYVYDCLERLESEGLIDSEVIRYKREVVHSEARYVDPYPFGVPDSMYWKRNN